ncbi:MAG: response regulator transcription factor [Gammaproteobacteria bacterium]|nr:response regulator transcription factor [Gammaproteobacteria bacterium]NIR83528.1 response regulator transcription factor [Gammaproteobacteria bacterium]NIR91450.1 response regulator transcription factor [Gammaproteobacteria bacterium]NIU04690.1 response regulator transcription factor [Gammaproteobacteria bacterium]NIV51732.1 response regulator [Gammaproteobacteria bacterium]
MAAPTVFIVDDDDAVRDALQLLMESAGLRAEAYASGQAFLDAYRLDRAGCLVLDIRMPGLSGLELQEHLSAAGISLPVIMLTGHGDVPAAVRALKAGAVDFLEKPYDSDMLLERVQQAITRDAQERRVSSLQAETTQRLEQLTPREREVMELIVAGKANKVVAFELQISERTVELHRARIMKKMGVRSLPELMRLVLRSGARANR